MDKEGDKMIDIYLVESNSLHAIYYQETIQKILEEKKLPYSLHTISDPDRFFSSKNVRYNENTVFIINMHVNKELEDLRIAENIRHRSNGFIIFFCQDEKYILQSLHKHIFPYDFIIQKTGKIKETEGELRKVLSSVVSTIFQRWNYTIRKLPNDDKLVVSWGSSWLVISLKNIIYIETLKASKNKTRVVTITGEFIVNHPLNALKQKFTSDNFCLSLKSFIFNLDNIVYIDRREMRIKLINGEELYVGIRIINQVKRDLEKHVNVKTK